VLLFEGSGDASGDGSVVVEQALRAGKLLLLFLADLAHGLLHQHGQLLGQITVHCTESTVQRRKRLGERTLVKGRR
jgi:hypothetical protein